MADINGKVGAAEENDQSDERNMALKDTESTRWSKQAEKALEEKLHKLMHSRRGVLGYITSKKNEIEKLKG